MNSALVATDFSAESAAAARRAAGIARQAGLRGALLHVVPGSLPAELHVHAASQAQQALSALSAELKREGADFEPRLASGDVAGEVTRAADGFDLVVAGARGSSVLLDFALGRTSVRLVRESRRPTLIVKRTPEAPYRRVLAAVDFSEPSYTAATCGKLVAPQADFDLVHAFEVDFESTLRRVGTREDLIEAYRLEAHARAVSAMESFASRLAFPRERVRTSVARGYPPRVILNAAEKAGAQLVVIGKRAAGAVERALVGSVSLKVLEMAQCDVLVVPEMTA